MDQQWNATYQNNIIPALKRLRKVQGVILGFHSVIDGIKRVKSDEIETILNANLDLKQSVQKKIYAMPIETWRHFRLYGQFSGPAQSPKNFSLHQPIDSTVT